MVLHQVNFFVLINFQFVCRFCTATIFVLFRGVESYFTVLLSTLSCDWGTLSAFFADNNFFCVAQLALYVEITLVPGTCSSIFLFHPPSFTIEIASI
jgi:hypothetical protein